MLQAGFSSRGLQCLVRSSTISSYKRRVLQRGMAGAWLSGLSYAGHGLGSPGPDSTTLSLHYRLYRLDTEER